jgi:hypothetical protein
MTRHLAPEAASAIPSICPLLSCVFGELLWGDLASISDLQHLEALSVGLIGEPAPLRPMPSLRYLDVGPGEGLWAILSRCPGLRTLMVTEHVDPDFVDLGLVPDLRILDLRTVDGDLDQLLPLANRLQALFATFTSEADVAAIAARCKDLRVLGIESPSCSPEALSVALGALNRLEELRIDTDDIGLVEAVSRSIPSTVRRVHFGSGSGNNTPRMHALMCMALGRCARLTHVSLCSLPADDLQCLLLSKILPKLEHLCVDGSDLTPSGVRLLAERCDYLQTVAYRPLTEAYVRTPRTCFVRDYKRFEHDVLNACRRCDEY